MIGAGILMRSRSGRVFLRIESHRDSMDSHSVGSRHEPPPEIPTPLRSLPTYRLNNVDQENSSRDPYRGRLPKSRWRNTQRVKRNRTSPTAVGAILFCVTKIEDDTAFFMSPVCGYQYEIATNGELQQAFPGLTRSHRRRQIGVRSITSGVAEHYRDHCHTRLTAAIKSQQHNCAMTPRVCLRRRLPRFEACFNDESRFSPPTASSLSNNTHS